MTRLIAVVVLAAVAQTELFSNETELRAKLLSPVDTRTSRKDDVLTVQVTAPEALAGSMLEGKIRESKSGNKINGKSVLTFAFETLHHKGQVIKISSAVKSIANSKGQQNVDEEGRVLRQSNSLGKAAIATGAGALLGAALGGAKGAAIGAGAGAAAALIFIQFGTEGPYLSFAPGSELVLSVKQR